MSLLFHLFQHSNRPNFLEDWHTSWTSCYRSHPEPPSTFACCFHLDIRNFPPVTLVLVYNNLCLIVFNFGVCLSTTELHRSSAFLKYRFSLPLPGHNGTKSREQLNAPAYLSPRVAVFFILIVRVVAITQLSSHVIVGVTRRVRRRPLADVVVFAASHGPRLSTSSSPVSRGCLRCLRATVTFTPPLGLSVSSGCLRCLLRRCCMTIFVFVITTVTVIIIAQLPSSPRCPGAIAFAWLLRPPSGSSPLYGCGLRVAMSLLSSHSRLLHVIFVVATVAVVVVVAVSSVPRQQHC